MRLRVHYLVAFLAVFFLSQDVGAQSPCGKRSFVLEMLAQEGYELHGSGPVRGPGNVDVLEIYISGDVWALILTDYDSDTSCVRVQGKDWALQEDPAV